MLVGGEREKYDFRLALLVNEWSSGVLGTGRRIVRFYDTTCCIKSASTYGHLHPIQGIFNVFSNSNVEFHPTLIQPRGRAIYSSSTHSLPRTIPSISYMSHDTDMIT